MTTKKTELATKTRAVELGNPNAVLKFATELKGMIVQNKLFTNIRGKNYVNVEGWQIAGAFTGTYPIVEKVENLGTGALYKYRAEVSLRDKDGNKVGYGVAVCTNREKGKRDFDEYAVASMAQTRAVGKAYRLKIGWLLKVAGYETTPAEEMDSIAEAETSERLDFDELRAEISEISSEAELLKSFYKVRDSYDLSEKQLAAVKNIYAERKAEVRSARANSPNEDRDYDAEGKTQREYDESTSLARQSAEYEMQRENISERMRSYDG